jgi:2-polyprenyl-3-methyl-5-hydroxy-6-metoxy-1,4-benzoquinol methylase
MVAGADFMNTGSMNVDPAESPSSAPSPTAGGIPPSEFRPLHEINPLRLAHIERLVGGLAASARSMSAAAADPRGGDGCERRRA